MFWKFFTTYGLVVAVAVALVVGTIAARFAFFIAPFAWTGEPERLAGTLGLQPGMQVADIGAGSGALALAMVPFIGARGQIYATELDAGRRAAIEQRISRGSAQNVRAIAAGDAETGLPERCCDAVYMRAVFHHVGDGPGFAADVARALRPGGRVAVIDFAPGTLWFHGDDHGVSSDTVIAAFQAAGLRLRRRVDEWGGGMFLLLFDGDAGAD